ncbi:hypothetical protein B0H19DRAFT_1063483 [Mycena capillaripes]|nr:hypothetical protein B0H19DRAFT_1063483 [Mycena capillaripes]
MSRTGIAALAIRNGKAHKPDHRASYFDGDWRGRSINALSLNAPTAQAGETKCVGQRGVGEAKDVNSSAEFTTDLAPLLSMTKLADVTVAEGVRIVFADVLVPGEREAALKRAGGGSDVDAFFCFFFSSFCIGCNHRDSWWEGKFEYPNNV